MYVSMYDLQLCWLIFVFSSISFLYLCNKVKKLVLKLDTNEILRVVMFNLFIPVCGQRPCRRLQKLKITIFVLKLIYFICTV